VEPLDTEPASSLTNVDSALGTGGDICLKTQTKPLYRCGRSDPGFAGESGSWPAPQWTDCWAEGM